MSEQASEAPPSTPALWTEDLVTRLRRLWTEDGLSTSEIAKSLSETTGVPISRSAINGKLHRLGLTEADKPGRAVPNPAPAAPAKPAAGKTAPAPKAPPPEAPAPAPILALPFQPAQPPHKPRRASDGLPGVSLFDAWPNQCRWVLDTPRAIGTRFCGEPIADPRRSWCAAHLAIGVVRKNEGGRPATRPPVQLRRIGRRVA